MNFYADSQYRVYQEQAADFVLSKAATLPKGAETETDKEKLKAMLKGEVKKLAELQQDFYADGRFSLLLVFQAMDAAGKDSVISNVFSGVNPAGFQVFSFKQPSSLELAHPFLWRTTICEPARGHIGIFNRSYYEETLVVRVHPEYLAAQKLDTSDQEALWQQRFAAIRHYEQYLANNGTLVLKFFLNVSRKEQHSRFLKRLEDVRKQWKFSEGDLKESALWDKYMHAYQQTIAHTSTDNAPWYVIPANKKAYMYYQVADIVRQTLQNMPLQYPQLQAPQEQLLAWKAQIKDFLQRC